jgi:hypothetical protein
VVPEHCARTGAEGGGGGPPSLLQDEEEDEDEEEDDERGEDIVEREDNDDVSSPESLAAGFAAGFFAAGFFAGGVEPSALAFAFFAARLDPAELPALLVALPSSDPPRFRLWVLDELDVAVAVAAGAVAGARGGIGTVSTVAKIPMGPSTTVPDGAGVLLDGAGTLVDGTGGLLDDAGALLDGAGALLGGPEDEEPVDEGLEDEEPDEDLADPELRGEWRGDRRAGGAVVVVPVVPGPAAGGAVEGPTKSEVADPIPSPSLNSMPSYRSSSATVLDDENEALDPIDPLPLPSPSPSPPTVAVFTTSDPADDPKVDNNCMRLLLANFLASDPLHSSSDSHFSAHPHCFAGSCEQAL